MYQLLDIGLFTNEGFDASHYSFWNNDKQLQLFILVSIYFCRIVFFE